MFVSAEEQFAKEKRKFLTNKKSAIELNETICIEWFRLVAYIAILTVAVAGSLFSKKFVFIPDDDVVQPALRGSNGTDGELLPLASKFVLFGVEHPYARLEDTAILKIFGIPHVCSFLDIHPAKEVGAILLPFFSLPMTIFLILAHYRNKLVCVNNPDSEEAKSLYRFSKWTTFFTVSSVQLGFIWFLNDPDEDYPKGFGFVGHFIPYALLQWGVAVTAIMQVKYDIFVDKTTFGVPAWLARLYVILFVALTIVYDAIVFGILAGHPIIDSKNGGWELLVFTLLTKVYDVASMVVPIATSVWKIKYNGDTHSFSMAIQ